jgi:hypothetical protein
MPNPWSEEEEEGNQLEVHLRCVAILQGGLMKL